MTAAPEPTFQVDDRVRQTSPHASTRQGTVVSIGGCEWERCAIPDRCVQVLWDENRKISLVRSYHPAELVHI